MARNDAIQQKIELTGEKEYRAALKAANNELKALRSALKAETAELGTNATAQQKNEVKAKNLRKQIAEQEKVVSQLQTLLGEVNEKYADNRELITKWETSLNNARAKLADSTMTTPMTSRSSTSIRNGTSMEPRPMRTSPL